MDILLVNKEMALPEVVMIFKGKLRLADALGKNLSQKTLGWLGIQEESDNFHVIPDASLKDLASPSQAQLIREAALAEGMRTSGHLGMLL